MGRVTVPILKNRFVIINNVFNNMYSHSAHIYAVCPTKRTLFCYMYLQEDSYRKETPFLLFKIYQLVL